MNHKHTFINWTFSLPALYYKNTEKYCCEKWILQKVTVAPFPDKSTGQLEYVTIFMSLNYISQAGVPPNKSKEL